MPYISLLPLLLLLQCPQFIEGNDAEIEGLKSRVQNLTNQVQALTEKVNSHEETIKEMRETLDERQCEDDCTFNPKCIEKDLKRQEEKLNGVLNLLQVHGFNTSKPVSCAEIEGGRGWGVNRIYPDNKHPVPASCDRSAGGGWTVIQRRYNGDVDFFRGWEEYAEGFGDPAGEYWLGLHHIHALTKAQPMELYVRVIDFDVGSRYAKYSSFSVDSEVNKFRLNVGGFIGTAGDSLARQNGAAFSTKDRDNDEYNVDCSNLYHGAWWYEECHDSNLNGIFPTSKTDNPKYMSWRKLHNTYQSMKASTMMIRPLNFKPSS